MLVDDGNAAQPIAISLITGFLGSGKTTLLNHLLKHPEIDETAVLINEFGEIGLDHLLVAELGDDVVLLSSGCICCTVQGELVDSLKSLYMKRLAGQVPEFKRVVIETTGLADPIPIITCLMNYPLFKHVYRLESLVTTVDAVYGEGQLDAHPEAVKQVAVSDRLVITKTDLADDGTVEALGRRLTDLNPGAAQIPALFGCVSPNRLFDVALYDPNSKTLDVQGWLNEEAYAGKGDDAHEHGDHRHQGGRHGEHDHGRDQAVDVNRHDDHITTFCLYVDRPLPWHALVDWLDDLTSQKGDHLLRVKGVVNVEGEAAPFAIQCVQATRYTPLGLSAWPDDDHRSRIVFITQDLPKSAVEASLSAMLSTLAPSPGPGARAKTAAGQPPLQRKYGSHERWLNDGEISRLFGVLAEHGNLPAANAIRLMLLTGTRWRDVQEARWPQFDLERGLWLKPSGESPDKPPRRIMLPGPALILLRELARNDAGSGWVFHGDGPGQPIGDIETFWDEVTAAALITGARLDHLRPSLASGLLSDQDPAVQRRLLGLSEKPRFNHPVTN